MIISSWLKLPRVIPMSVILSVYILVKMLPRWHVPRLNIWSNWRNRKKSGHSVKPAWIIITAQILSKNKKPVSLDIFMPHKSLKNRWWCIPVLPSMILWILSAQRNLHTVFCIALPRIGKPLKPCWIAVIMCHFPGLFPLKMPRICAMSPSRFRWIVC